VELVKVVVIFKSDEARYMHYTKEKEEEEKDS